ncbi:hypothetical protein TNCV_4424871 [Trichonephila clavipes]|nr:hypothetical protein TNCV_4424871 [Trichonephila clavipes]
MIFFYSKDNLVALHFKYDFWHKDCHGWLPDVVHLTSTSMTFSNICGRISAITRYVQHGMYNTLCLPNGQAFVAYPHRPMTLHSRTEYSLPVLNHKILEANSSSPKREIRRSPNVSFNKSIVARAV